MGAASGRDGRAQDRREYDHADRAARSIIRAASAKSGALRPQRSDGRFTPLAGYSGAAIDVDLVALDLDGTLVDSAPDLCHCLGVALAALGLPAPTEAQTRGWIGGGVELLLERALRHRLGRPPERPVHAEALRTFSACYERNLFARSRLYPDVPATLAALERRGIALHCITNKRVAFAEGLLELAGIRASFALVLGGDSLPEKKPSGLQLETAARLAGVAAERALMVGDSNQDLHAARAAGFRFAWATYGYCAKLDAPLSDLDLGIDRFAELGALLAT